MAAQPEVDLVFKALSDPTRREILRLTDGSALAVVAIAGRFPEMSRPAISKHLRILRQAGLVEEEKQGRKRLYRLQKAPLEAVWQWLSDAGAGDMHPQKRRGRARASQADVAPRPVEIVGDDWRSW